MPIKFFSFFALLIFILSFFLFYFQSNQIWSCAPILIVHCQMTLNFIIFVNCLINRPLSFNNNDKNQVFKQWTKISLAKLYFTWLYEVFSFADLCSLDVIVYHPFKYLFTLSYNCYIFSFISLLFVIFYVYIVMLMIDWWMISDSNQIIS